MLKVAKYRIMIFLLTNFCITQIFYNYHGLLSEWEITLFFFLNNIFIKRKIVE